MCYGLDPKYQMREIEARVKTLSFMQDTQKLAAPIRVMARMRDIVAWLLRKGAPNV